MTITTAITEARQLVTMSRWGNQWKVYRPWRFSDPHGTSSESAPVDYWRAQYIRAGDRALLALMMLGHEDLSRLDYLVVLDRERHSDGFESTVRRIHRRLQKEAA